MTPSNTPRSRRLLVLRHAKSSWSQPGATDFQRPLNERGRAAASQMGNKLRAEQMQVDIILASTALRVRETLELLLPAWQHTGPVVWEEQLYHASPQTLTQHLSALDSSWSSALVVGHNPGLSEFVSQLTGSAVEMPTTSIAVLECKADDWPSALRLQEWTQLAFWKPKEL